MRRAFSFFTALAGLLMVVAIAHAGEVPFNQAQFDRALKAGKPVVVDFYADWCSSCRVQKSVTQTVLADPGMQDVTVFVAHYDTERALKRSLKVTVQSTLVVFKGGKEVARSIGETQREALAALFSQAL